MEDKIVSTILNDKELLDYVERLVAKRLPAGPYLKADLAWYQQVVDLTINQAFEDLQVVETLNYQISQLGEYLKKKSEDKSKIGKDNRDIETDIDYSEDRIIDHPSFSSSEPVQRTRKPRKNSSKKLNHQQITNNDQSSRILQRQTIKQQLDESQGPHDFIREDAEVHLIASNTKLHNTYNRANTGITDDNLSLYRSRNNDLNDPQDQILTRDSNGNGSRGIEVFHYVDEPIKPSMSYSNQLNNLQQNLNYSKNSNDIHGSNSNKKIVLHVDNAVDLKNSGNDLPSRSSTSRYSDTQPSRVTESAESYLADPAIHLEERILSRTAEKNQKSQSLMSTTGGFLIHKEMNRKNDANNVQNGKIFSSTTPLQRGDEENYGLRTFQESLHNQYERSDNAGFGENGEGYKTNGANFNINYQIPENGDQSFDIISNNNNYSNIFESSITESQADTIVMGNDYGIVSDSENDTDEKYYDESANDRKMEYDKNQVEIEVKLGKNAVPESRITPKKDEKDSYNDNKNINLIRQPNKFEEEEEAEAEEVDEENQVEDDNNVEEEEEEEEEEGDENYAADEDQEQNYYDDEEFNSVDQDEKNNSLQNHSPQKTSKNGNEIENNNDSLTEKINNIEKSKNHEIYSSWSLPSDNVRRVQFATKIISDTFTIREKHSLFEIPTLFYTHDESIQFTNDYNRESLKAEAVGLTWYEWWDDREDEDVRRDDEDWLKEQNNLKYEEESIDDDMSDADNDFDF